MIKAVIFDMDGVLVDAKNWHYEALNRALALFGHCISRFDHLTMYDGLPTSKKLKMLSLERGLPEGLHTFINEMKQIYTLELVHAKCKPTFIHQYALSTLKAIGYQLALASNSIRATVDIMMQKVQLDGYLDVVVSASDIQRPKPDPEIYIKVFSCLNLHPKECLIVEDNENGIKAAMASDAYVLAVNDVNDVTFQNIMSYINRIEAGKHP